QPSGKGACDSDDQGLADVRDARNCPHRPKQQDESGRQPYCLKAAGAVAARDRHNKRRDDAYSETKIEWVRLLAESPQRKNQDWRDVHDLGGDPQFGVNLRDSCPKEPNSEKGPQSDAELGHSPARSLAERTRVAVPVQTERQQAARWNTDLNALAAVPS